MRIRDKGKRIGRLPGDRGRSMRGRHLIGGTCPVRAYGNTVFPISNGMGKGSAAERNFCGSTRVSLCGIPLEITGMLKHSLFLTARVPLEPMEVSGHFLPLTAQVPLEPKEASGKKEK